MTTKQMKQVKEQLPDGAKIVCAYRAAEGGIRVCVKMASGLERLYKVTFEGLMEYPRIELF